MYTNPSLIELLAIRLSPQAGKSLVIPRRRKSSKTMAPQITSDFAGDACQLSRMAITNDLLRFLQLSQMASSSISSSISGQCQGAASLCEVYQINWIPACTKSRQFATRQAECKVDTAGMTKQRGGGLIELIMFIVIVSIALAGIVLVMNTTTGHSADAIVRKQAQAVADSLLEGIESQSFSNIPAAINGVTTASGIAGYSASAVSNTSAWGNIPATSAVQITVTVTDPTGQTTSVTGYRTNY